MGTRDPGRERKQRAPVNGMPELQHQRLAPPERHASVADTVDNRPASGSGSPDTGSEMPSAPPILGTLVVEDPITKRLISQFLIPSFAPTLATLRTVCLPDHKTIGQSIEWFGRTIRHTDPDEAGDTWVILPGNRHGESLASQLRDRFRLLEVGRVVVLGQPTIERYFPPAIGARSIATPGDLNEDRPRTVQDQTLDDLAAWMDADRERALVALQDSAVELLHYLTQIDRTRLRLSGEP